MPNGIAELNLVHSKTINSRTSTIARNPNTFAKRQREMEKKQKAEDKRKRREERKKNPGTPEIILHPDLNYPAGDRDGSGEE